MDVGILKLDDPLGVTLGLRSEPHQRMHCALKPSGTRSRAAITGKTRGSEKPVWNCQCVGRISLTLKPRRDWRAARLEI